MQRLLYLLIYPLLWATSILPMRLLYIKSDCLYILAYHVFRYRKKVVLSNLKLVFPEKTEKERKAIAKAFYHHLCDIIFETIKSMTISEEEAKRRFDVQNIELLRDYESRGRSVLMFCGHYASWEWSSIINRQTTLKGLGVYKKLDNPYFDRLVKKIRGKFGAEIISNKKIVTSLFRLNKKGIKTVSLVLADQTPKVGAFKHRDTFMGIDVPVFTGTEELAKKLNFAVVYMKVEKVRRGYYKANFIPLAEDPNSYPDFDITRMFLNEIEKQIHKEPQYYLWSHKRWKLRNTLQ
ncbi:lysophospholipid acyltransferase family protein [Constantimarinum furrinae]|uniref:Kdo2-lipid IVA lauroyltransferase n=1 Tax=Constantimarinum furrinae TaxID=2562285 RepID=A0A7G8PXA6_9FLAO|nr:lysophospholipid acyltransferase family protein [Constantimarinum furrinae]QNJ98972.1 Kdo2-lipid IVA lauroyltransferase [Constantimarinum furrinae]